MRGVWAGGLRLWCRSVSLRIFEKIRSQANRGRRRRNFEAECYATAVPALPCAISPYFISDGAFARALPGGQRSSPTRPNQEQLSHFARAVAFEPQSPYRPASSDTPRRATRDASSRCRSHRMPARSSTRSACEHSNAQRGRRCRRGRCRGGDPRRTMALLGRARLRGSGARDPCSAPQNAGVQGGTESSNLLCSSGESCANC